MWIPSPLDLPAELIPLLDYFDGRPTKAALERIEDEAGVELEPQLVRLLVDFGVLTPK